ncbi:MAG: LysM peptidoglycan-binding domain-containing protein [Defluviitaleaceae bacterium]|nr:LysM peptidoglycan-binding domain-containing protein [Defluviitaleaceae bacterium]
MGTITNGRLVHANVIQQTTSRGHNLPSSRALANINRITVHHTVSGNTNAGQNPTIATVNNWWDRSNGDIWDRAGYHFLIRGDGSIWQLVPVHAPSWGAGPTGNPPSIHVAFAGTFTSTVLPTQAARNSFGLLCSLLLGSAQLPNLNNNTHIIGHRVWGGTECPGFTQAQYRSWAGNTSTPPTTPPPSGNGTHVVQAGQTLFSIAQMHNTTVAELQRLNNMGTSTVIQVGQVLRVPGGARTHTVQSGQTLFSIAQMFNTTVAAIQQVNGMGSSTVIHVGQVLIIP